MYREYIKLCIQFFFCTNIFFNFPFRTVGQNIYVNTTSQLTFTVQDYQCIANREREGERERERATISLKTTTIYEYKCED